MKICKKFIGVKKKILDTYKNLVYDSQGDCQWKK